MTWTDFIPRLTANHDQNLAILTDAIRKANVDKLADLCEVLTSKSGDPITDAVRALAHVGLSGILIAIANERGGGGGQDTTGVTTSPPHAG